MRAVVQRVSRARVTVDARIVGEISKGLMILLGVGRTDTAESASYLAGKIANLRIFPDDISAGDVSEPNASQIELTTIAIKNSSAAGNSGKMNRSVLDVSGSALVISQFTLYGDTRGGRRPSYTQAAPPEVAIMLYEEFVRGLRSLGVRVETGVFQAHMEVELVNDGPITLLVDSEKSI